MVIILQDKNEWNEFDKNWINGGGKIELKSGTYQLNHARVTWSTANEEKHFEKAEYWFEKVEQE